MLLWLNYYILKLFKKLLLFRITKHRTAVAETFLVYTSDFFAKIMIINTTKTTLRSFLFFLIFEK